MNKILLGTCFYTLTIALLLGTLGFEAKAFNPDEMIDPDATYEPLPKPQLFDTSVTIDNDDKPPHEPNLAQFSFKKLPPVNSLDERIDRMIGGVKVNISPEFDHYGYEIRRYMARVGNLKIFDDREYLEQQIKNVRKASVIADYWKDYMEKELKEVEAIVEKGEGVSFAERTKFKQHKIAIRTFLISLRGWLDANERFLTTVYKNPDMFEVSYPEIMISNNGVRVEFYNSLMLRQTKANDMKNYQPFEMMVY